MEFIDIDALVECYKQDPQMTDDKWVQWAQACAARVAHLDSHHSNEAVRTAGYAALNAERATYNAVRAAARDAARDAVRAAAYTAAYTAARDAVRAAAYTAARDAVRAAGYAVARAAARDAFNAERLWQCIELMRIYHEGEG